MKHLKKLTFAVALLATTTAYAADYDILDPAPVAEWGGLYAGVSAGGSILTLEAGNLFVRDEVRARGGVHLGYLAQSGAWVFGGEVEGMIDRYATTVRGKVRIGGTWGNNLTTLDAGVVRTQLRDFDLEDTGFTVGATSEFQMANNWRFGVSYAADIFSDPYGIDATLVDHNFTVRLSRAF